MCGLYVVYVAVTFVSSRADEPLHADVALREVPPVDGGVGEQAVLLPHRVGMGVCAWPGQHSVWQVPPCR
jgi:hypothetical protein